jgi:hypothetical protein
VGIKVQDRKRLWGQARNQCAFPGCAQQLIQQLRADEPDPLLVLGEEAHIRSGRRDGPRYDPNYDPRLVDTYDNLILLCSTHHTLIDKDGGIGFRVDELSKMRRRHESAVAKDERLERVYRAYLADRYDDDDQVLFEAVDLNGPSVESMFVDVPIARQLRRRLATLSQASMRPRQEMSRSGMSQGSLRSLVERRCFFTQIGEVMPSFKADLIRESRRYCSMSVSFTGRGYSMAKALASRGPSTG